MKKDTLKMFNRNIRELLRGKNEDKFEFASAICVRTYVNYVKKKPKTKNTYYAIDLNFFRGDRKLLEK